MNNKYILDLNSYNPSEMGIFKEDNIYDIKKKISDFFDTELFRINFKNRTSLSDDVLFLKFRTEGNLYKLTHGIRISCSYYDIIMEYI